MVLLMAGYPLQAAIKSAPSEAAATRPDEDADHDALTNQEEAQRGTNPHNPDTDGDGKGDAQDAVGYDPFFTFDAAPETTYAVIGLKSLFTVQGLATVNNNGTVVMSTSTSSPYVNPQFQVFLHGQVTPPVEGLFFCLNNQDHYIFKKKDRQLEIQIGPGDQAPISYAGLVGFQPGISYESFEGDIEYFVDKTANVWPFAFSDTDKVWSWFSAGFSCTHDAPASAPNDGFTFRRPHYTEPSPYGWGYVALHGQTPVPGTSFASMIDFFQSSVFPLPATVNFMSNLWNVSERNFPITHHQAVSRSNDWATISDHYYAFTNRYQEYPYDLNYDTPTNAGLPTYRFSDGFTFATGDGLKWQRGGGWRITDIWGIGRLPGQPGLWKIWRVLGQGYDDFPKLSLTGPDDGKPLRNGGPTGAAIYFGGIATNGLIPTSQGGLWRNGRVVPNPALVGPGSPWQIQAIASTSDNGLFLLASARNTANGQTDAPVEPVLLVPCDLAVDANRDGVIKFAGNFDDPNVADKPADKTTQDKPFRFWCNDDQDSTFGTTEGENFIEGERTPVAVPDSNNNQIVAKRDLEDFTRLWIHIGAFYQELQDTNGKLQVGLKWKNTNDTSPSIKVYSSADPEGSTSYLTSETAAGAQIAPIINATEGYGVSLGEVKESGVPFIFKKEFWTGYSEANPKKCLIFEGSGEGKGQLCITILDAEGHEIGEGPGVWLDLKDIRKMYQSSEGDVFSRAPPGEVEHTLVFVHGWNMSPEGSRSFAETMFKRLWHRGFKGRFAYFRWNTGWSSSWQWLPVGGGVIDAHLAEYNKSEYTAWTEAAPALQAFVASLPYATKNIAAHSMGNIVASEALRLGMSVNNYALMQAAVPAACYDEDEERIKQPANYTHYGVPMWNTYSPDDDQDPFTRERAYRGRFANLSGNLVSFFLESDYATFAPWELNNRLNKPPSEFVPNFIYNRTATSGQKLRKYSNLGVTFQYYITDPYEAMAFACNTWGKAAGAWGATRGKLAGAGVDLSDTAYQLAGEQRSGFGDEHSGQFNANIQSLKQFYDTLMRRLDIGEPNP